MSFYVGFAILLTIQRMLAYVQAGGNGGNIRAFSRKFWEVTSLYVENNNSAHVKESKQVVDSGFRRLDSGFRIPCLWIPDSKFFKIPDSKVLNFGFLQRPIFCTLSMKSSI